MIIYIQFQFRWGIVNAAKSYIFTQQIHLKSLKTIKKAYESFSTENDRKMCTCSGLIPATTGAASNQNHIG